MVSRVRQRLKAYNEQPYPLLLHLQLHQHFQLLALSLGITFVFLHNILSFLISRFWHCLLISDTELALNLTSFPIMLQLCWIWAYIIMFMEILFYGEPNYTICLFFCSCKPLCLSWSEYFTTFSLVSGVSFELSFRWSNVSKNPPVSFSSRMFPTAIALQCPLGLQPSCGPAASPVPGASFDSLPCCVEPFPPSLVAPPESTLCSDGAHRPRSS